MKATKYLFFLLFLLFGVLAFAADWNCKINLPPNPQNYPKELLLRMMYVDITNSEHQAVTVYLHGEVRRDGKLIGKGNSNKIEIPPGGKRITRSDITKIKKEWWDKEFEKLLFRMPTLPAGDYEACIFVYKAKGKKLLTKCCSGFESKPISPPRLISPKDGATLKEKYPLFRWTPPAPAPKEITYTLRIVEVRKGQTKEEAIKNPPLFEKEGIKETSFRYPASAREFEKGKQYAWMVIGITAMIKYESEVWEFTYKRKSSMEPTPWNVITGAVVVVISSDDEDEELSLKPISPVGLKPIKTPNPTFIWHPLILRKNKKTKAKYSIFIMEHEPQEMMKQKGLQEKLEWSADSIKKYVIYYKEGLKDTSFTYPKDAPSLKEGKFYTWFVATVYKDKFYASDTGGGFLYKIKVKYSWILKSLKNISPDPSHYPLHVDTLYDFGDAPGLFFPTTKASNGARHYWSKVGVFPIHNWFCTTIWAPGINLIPSQQSAWLGPLRSTWPLYPPCPRGCNSSVSVESDARLPDDSYDDGVYFFPSLTRYCDPCDTDSVDVMINLNRHYNRSNPLYLYAWFDWNSDWDWNDVDTCPDGMVVWEAIHWFGARRLCPNPAPATLTPDGRGVIINPSEWHKDTCAAIYRLYLYRWPSYGYSSGRVICTRFRLTPEIPPNSPIATSNAGSYTGEVISGEVEDYVIECMQLKDTLFDFGDAPDELDPPGNTHYCSHLILGGCDWGPRVSPFPWNTRDAARHGDFSQEWLGNITVGMPTACGCPGPSSDAECNARTINLDMFDNGVDFTHFHFPVVPCRKETVDVLINTSGNSARYAGGKYLYLHAWFDWNRDGDWDDTYNCEGIPADEHIFWLTAKPLCPAPGAVMPVNDYAFRIDPTTWPGWPQRKCMVYRLTFLGWGPIHPPYPTDTLWCRFRLSYDPTATGATSPFVAKTYWDPIGSPNPYGEVEDYPLYYQRGGCQCEIIKFYVDGTTVEPGDEISIHAGTRTISVAASCNGPGCSITSYDWTITKPDGTTETGTGSSFPYPFLCPEAATCSYTVKLTITCSDGTTCTGSFSIHTGYW